MRSNFQTFLRHDRMGSRQTACVHHVNMTQNHISYAATTCLFLFADEFVGQSSREEPSAFQTQPDAFTAQRISIDLHFNLKTLAYSSYCTRDSSHPEKQTFVAAPLREPHTKITLEL